MTKKKNSKAGKKPENLIFDANKMLLSNKSSFTIQEAYKTLRTNITFSLPGSDCKCIGIISANRGDGKSSIASNLAISLGQIQKRVVLIDCDLRLPTIAAKFQIESVPGLSNYLSGGTTELPIMKVEKRGIDIIPSGNIPPDSTTLISSQGMIDLVNKLKTMYDYIVFDFPPINIVSDAVMMASMIDGYLIVVRHERSEYQMLGETVRQMRFADAKIIGFVYNGKGEEKKYYKRGYGKNKYYNSYYYKNYYYKSPKSS